MKLTKNEKKVLKLLLENARITDSAIASKLKISSQAVGKIRKKLEGTIIDSYSLNINYSKIGVHLFAISLSKLTNEGLDKGELEIEEKLMKTPQIIQIYRLPHSSITHIILYGFKDMEDLDNYFHSPKNNKELFRHLENKDLYTFSHNSLIKNNPTTLFKTLIDEIESPKPSSQIKELENFRKKIAS